MTSCHAPAHRPPLPAPTRRSARRSCVTPPCACYSSGRVSRPTSATENPPHPPNSVPLRRLRVAAPPALHSSGSPHPLLILQPPSSTHRTAASPRQAQKKAPRRPSAPPSIGCGPQSEKARHPPVKLAFRPRRPKDKARFAESFNGEYPKPRHHAQADAQSSASVSASSRWSAAPPS